jgi:hypothetical protein
LGERLNGIQEVRSSILLGSTTSLTNIIVQPSFKNIAVQIGLLARRAALYQMPYHGCAIAQPRAL